MSSLSVLTRLDHIEASKHLKLKEYQDSALCRATRPVDIPNEPMKAFRASQKFRVWGCTNGRVFHVLWFDRNHVICPD